MGECLPQLPAAGRLQGLAQLVETGPLVKILPIKAPQPGQKGLIPQFQAQHMEQHQPLVVAHRLGGGVMAAAKIGQGKGPGFGDEIGKALQGRPAMLGALALLLLEQMIGQIGSQPFAPVALGIVWIDTVAPPVVEDLMGIGGMEDKGQPDDPGAQQGKGGHSIAALPEVLHQGEFGIGVGSQQAAIEIQIMGGGLQIASGQGRVVLAQKGQGPGRLGGAGILLEGTGDQVDILLGQALLPHLPHPLGGFTAAVAATLGNPSPGFWQSQFQAKADLFVTETGIPGSASV